jgi:hypothetical protein
LIFIPDRNRGEIGTVTMPGTEKRWNVRISGLDICRFYGDEFPSGISPVIYRSGIP